MLLPSNSILGVMNTIDARAPRTNQLLVSLTVLISYLIEQPLVLPILAAVLVVGAAFGRKYIPAYYLYFRVIQPIVGEGRTEDERAPTFAQAMGASGLIAGYALIATGHATAGWLLVACLALAALYSTARDFCVGCKSYELLARLKGISRWRAERIDPADVSLGESAEPTLVEFFHPKCSACQVWKRRLEEGNAPFVTIDVTEHPELARRYGVAMVPTVLEVAPGGTVIRQLAP
jgi:hypothetical protein